MSHYLGRQAAVLTLLTSASLVGLAPLAHAASDAQSSSATDQFQAASSVNPEVIVTARRRATANGLISVVEQPKAESIVTDAFIKTQTSGSNPYQLLALAPGVNTNARGSTGLDMGSISIRGFQGNQLGVSLDGVPINDSGTYNTFPQEYVDTDNLSQIYVLQGAGDAETPNISATGGVIGMTIRKPADVFTVTASGALGMNDYSRQYVRVDTGELGNGNSAFISYSHAYTRQWRGVGRTYRDHIDASFQHVTDNGDLFSISVFANRQNIAQYQALTAAQVAQLGYFHSYNAVFTPSPTPVSGTAQSDNDSAVVANPALQRSAFNQLNRNPFKNVVVSTKMSLGVTDQLRFDLQPYLWYGEGNGTVGTYVSEGNTALLGSARDLNGDGDTLDTVLFSNPFAQTQIRPGFISRIKWNPANQEIVAGFHFEYANLREFRPFIRIDPNTGIPIDPWGLDSAFESLQRTDGSFVRNRDQKTLTTTIRPFLQDVIHLADDRAVIALGAQFPIVKRTGYNYLPLSLRTSAGQVAPSEVRLTQKRFLPNAGITFKIDKEHSVFASVAKTFRANDNVALFQTGADLDALKPETAVDIEAGYRYAGSLLTGSLTLYHINYSNRQQLLFDTAVGNTITKNIGDVTQKGIEAEIGTHPIQNFSFYLSGSYNNAKLDNDVAVGVAGQTANRLLPTKGKRLVDTPLVTLAGQVRYDDSVFFGHVQAKYTGVRYATLVNDERLPGFVKIDLALGYNLPENITHGNKAKISLNLDNLTNKRYFGSVNFGNNLYAVNGLPSNPATYFLGAPRFFSAKLDVQF